MNRRLLILVATLLVAACSGNLTVGGLTGEATVVVSGDAADDQAAAVPRSTQRFAHPEATLAPATQADDDDDDDDSDDAEGEIEAELRLFLVARDGSVVALTDDEIHIDLDVQGRDEFVAVDRRTVPARTYETLRVVFSEFEIEIDSGLVIDGTPILGEIEVELEEDSLTVERPIQLVIDDGEDVELLVDLNARAWLLAVDPILQTVAEAALADAVSVMVR